MSMTMTYAIRRVASETREFDSQYGPRVAYSAQLDTGEWVEIVKKPDSPRPQAGQVTGQLLDPPRPGLLRKLKLEYTGGANGNGRGPRDPKEIAQIQRQHSQEMALRLLAQTESFKGLDLTTANPQAKRAALELIAGVADWFDGDIAQGAQKAINAGGYGAEPARKDPAPTGQSDVPAPPIPAPDPVVASVGGDDSIPF